MAYLERPNPRRRAAALVTVGAVHVALGLALVGGLTVDGILQRPARIAGFTLDPPPPPPPPQPEQAEPDVEKAVAPEPDTRLVINDAVTVERYDDTMLPKIIPEIKPATDDRLILPPPTPKPSFAPKGATPRGQVSRWISTEDYPAGALRREEQGIARYRLVIASDGKVSACEITGTSGSADLDRETCRLLQRRAGFEPATDSSGARVVGTFSGSVRWDIPR